MGFGQWYSRQVAYTREFPGSIFKWAFCGFLFKSSPLSLPPKPSFFIFPHQIPTKNKCISILVHLQGNSLHFYLFLIHTIWIWGFYVLDVGPLWHNTHSCSSFITHTSCAPYVFLSLVLTSVLILFLIDSFLIHVQKGWEIISLLCTFLGREIP